MINLFDLKCWYDWTMRTVFVFGLFAIFVFVGMQVWGWEVTIGLPRIESVFRGHK